MSEKDRVYDYKKSEKGICKELVKNIKSKGNLILIFAQRLLRFTGSFMKLLFGVETKNE